MRYAEEEQDLALLSISTFQKALKAERQRHIKIATWSTRPVLRLGSKSIDSRQRFARTFKHTRSRYCAYYDACAEGGRFITHRPTDRSIMHSPSVFSVWLTCLPLWERRWLTQYQNCLGILIIWYTLGLLEPIVTSYDPEQKDALIELIERLLTDRTTVWKHFEYTSLLWLPVHAVGCRKCRHCLWGGLRRANRSDTQELSQALQSARRRRRVGSTGDHTDADAIRENSVSQSKCRRSGGHRSEILLVDGIGFRFGRRGRGRKGEEEEKERGKGKEEEEHVRDGFGSQAASAVDEAFASKSKRGGQQRFLLASRLSINKDFCLLQVVLAVAQLYFHTAPAAEHSVVIRPLVRLLRSHRWKKRETSALDSYEDYLLVRFSGSFWLT